MTSRTKKAATERDISFQLPLAPLSRLCDRPAMITAKRRSMEFAVNTIRLWKDRVDRGTREIRPSILGVKPEGILGQAVAGFPEIADSLFKHFSRVLSKVVKSPQAREILSSAPNEISTAELGILFSLASRTMPATLATKRTALRSFARGLSFCDSPLRDGKTVEEAASIFFSKLKLPAEGIYYEITTKSTINGHEAVSTKIINLDILGIGPDGVLAEALSGAPDVVHVSDFYRFYSVLTRLAEMDEGRTLLSTPAAQMNAVNILRLFSLVYQFLPKIKSRGLYFTSFKRFMTFSLAYLESGQSFADAARDLHFNAYDQIEATKGEAENRKSAEPNHILDKLKSISATSDDDAFDQASVQLRAHMDTYLIACEQILNEQKECVAKIDAIVSSGPPETLPQRLLDSYKEGKIPSYDTMQRLPQDALDWLLLSYVHKEQMYIYGFSQNRGFGLSQLLLRYGMEATAGYAFDTALSQFYLTHRSIMACFVVLAICTGWNGSTIASLTPSRIQEAGSGYRLYGIKTKTNQLQVAEIEEVEWRTDSALACRAVELLLWHNHNVDVFGIRNTESVFCPLRLRFDGRRIAHLPKLAYSLSRFLKANNLPYISIRDYRTLRLNYTYVRGKGDIVATQIQAGHASLSTTARYLRLKINIELHDSNIRRYMRILAKSLLWVTGNKDLEDCEESAVARRLLFPASPYAAESGNSAADEWLASSGEMKIEITENDAIHCCYQKQFYEQHLEFLISFNENRFLNFHLPRISFCAALHRLLKRSPFSHVLRQSEFQ